MFAEKKQTELERFINVMEYKPVDKVPNYEAGVWQQTKQRWEDEGLNSYDHIWDWWTGDKSFGMDIREFIPVNYGMMPAFEPKILEKNDKYEIFMDSLGRKRKALVEGVIGNHRSCMDEYISFAVTDEKDFKELKKRYDPYLKGRYPAGWEELMLPGWKNRKHPLILGKNCSTLGFYWLLRDWMGTENVCYAWYDQPNLMHEMIEFIYYFTTEISKPILEKTDVDYVMINEDMSMKNGPLLSPETYRTFIFPYMKKLTEFFKSNGVRYVMVDTDGNCELLIPMLMEAGVDAIWPLERVADMDPVRLRKKFGKNLRLFGGVDKMELAKDKTAIDKHLKELSPLVEEGGFIPGIDHTASPDISLENFLYYMKRKDDLLRGKL